MELFVTRHGETQYNIETRICGHADIPLTKKGEEQARELAKEVEKYGIDLIVVSPLIRAKRTADILSEMLNIPIVEDERLKERNYGTIDGTYEGTPGFMEDWIQFGYIYPEGESLLKVVQRVYNFLEDIKDCYNGKKVLVVSHGGICRVINSYFNSLTNEEFFDFFLENCKVLKYEL